MIGRSLLLVYPLFYCVCTVLECSAGYPGWSSEGDNASKLNGILKTDGWKQVVTLALGRELKYANGSKLDLSDLLAKGRDGNIVTPANYTDKLMKSSTAVNCFYGENVKCINDFFIDILAEKCTALALGELTLDCVERYWQTMHINKSLIEQMLVVLNFFHNASSTMCPRTVIDVLESLLPHYDRRVYHKSNYLNHTDGTVKTDDFRRDYEFFLDKIKCANKILWRFLVARCLPSCQRQDEQSEGIRQIQEALRSLPTQPTVDTLFELYVETLRESETTFSPNLGFDEQ